jgi:hypothetical protein
MEIFGYAVYYRYEGYSSLGPEEDPGEGHEAHHHQGHDQEHRVAAHHARHILNSFQIIIIHILAESSLGFNEGTNSESTAI